MLSACFSTPRYLQVQIPKVGRVWEGVYHYISSNVVHVEIRRGNLSDCTLVQVLCENTIRLLPACNTDINCPTRLRTPESSTYNGILSIQSVLRQYHDQTPTDRPPPKRFRRQTNAGPALTNVRTLHAIINVRLYTIIMRVRRTKSTDDDPHIVTISVTVSAVMKHACTPQRSASASLHDDKSL